MDKRVLRLRVKTVGNANAAAELLIRDKEAQAGLGEPVRVVSNAEHERCAQAMNSTSHVSAIAGNRGQAGQKQSSDPPARSRRGSR